jgi:predicted nucleic acid-binding Zn ribbon protein
MINPWTGEDADRGLVLLNPTLEDVLERVTSGKLATFEMVRQVWGKILSETWRARSHLVKLENGVLTVEVSDGGVASRLRLEQRKIQAALEEHLGSGEVTQIRLRVNQSRVWPVDL